LCRKTLNLRRLKFFVLDDNDRMLDMGFDEQIDAIVRHMPRERQTFMFSATVPPEILRSAQKYLVDPERIAIDPVARPAENVRQSIVRTDLASKFSNLTREIECRQGSILVFVRTKIGAGRLAQKLRVHHFDAEAIHGDLRQGQRERVMRDFRNQKKRILVATDVAARGLDIPHIRHVINYDLPQTAEDYIHRVGRTARAGAEGCALSFVAPEESRRWKTIHRFVNGDPEAPTTPRGGRPKRKSRGNRPPFFTSGRRRGVSRGAAHRNSTPSEHPSTPPHNRHPVAPHRTSGRNRRDDSRRRTGKNHF
jgi:superfamily II DNA/RNA helicase